MVRVRETQSLIKQPGLPRPDTPTETRDFIERYVGPMVLKPDGDVERKETASQSEAVVKRSPAPARLLTLHLRNAFWGKFRRVA